jgi:hypothetical protein
LCVVINNSYHIDTWPLGYRLKVTYFSGYGHTWLGTSRADQHNRKIWGAWCLWQWYLIERI